MMQGLELRNKERAILEIGKMKSPIGYQEIKTAGMRKFGTPAPKTMENTRLSLEGKRGIDSLLKEHGLESILIKFQFTSVTNLRTAKACLSATKTRWFLLLLNSSISPREVYRNAQQNPQWGLVLRARQLETCYERKGDCQIPLTYTKRKDYRTFIKDSSWGEARGRENARLLSNVWEGRKSQWNTTDSQTEAWVTAIVLSKAKNHSYATRQRMCPFVTMVEFSYRR